jgi:hypothetical protein
MSKHCRSCAHRIVSKRGIAWCRVRNETAARMRRGCDSFTESVKEIEKQRKGGESMSTDKTEPTFDAILPPLEDWLNSPSGKLACEITSKCFCPRTNGFDVQMCASILAPYLQRIAELENCGIPDCPYKNGGETCKTCKDGN